MRVALAAAVLALVLPGIAPTVAGGSADSEIALSLDAPAAEWQGRYVALGAGQLVPACLALACEEIPVRVDFDAERVNAGLTTVVSWPSAEDDYDIYLYDAWGLEVASGATRAGNYEKFGVPVMKPGDYTLVVVPVFVIDSAHAGIMTLDVQP